MKNHFFLIASGFDLESKILEIFSKIATFSAVSEVAVKVLFCIQ